MGRRCIFAHTPTTYPSNPPYINLSVEDERLELTVRGAPVIGAQGWREAGPTVVVEVPNDKIGGLILALVDCLPVNRPS